MCCYATAGCASVLSETVTAVFLVTPVRKCEENGANYKLTPNK